MKTGHWVTKETLMIYDASEGTKLAERFPQGSYAMNIRGADLESLEMAEAMLLKDGLAEAMKDAMRYGL